jgi:hypothetical protein
VKIPVIPNSYKGLSKIISPFSSVAEIDGDVYNKYISSNIFVMYVCNETIKLPEVLKQISFPSLSFSVSGLNKYPRIWIGTTHYEQIQSVIYDKRSCYTKFKNHIRYHKDYMEIFKYIELMNGIEFSVGIHKLDSSDDPVILERLLMKYLREYRIYYGDSLICSDQEIKKLLEKSVKCDPPVIKPVKLVFEPDVPVEDRRRISRNNYEKNHRQQRIDKNKKYYEHHKEELKQKRQAKAALENAAQVVEP